MVKQYTAWDGNQYTFPPPKGWRLASDGKWWPPDATPSAQELSASPDSTQESASKPSNGLIVCSIAIGAFILAELGTLVYASTSRADPTVNNTTTATAEEYRQLLAEDGIQFAATDRSDTDIDEIGSLVCVVAGESSDADQWNTELERIVDQYFENDNNISSKPEIRTALRNAAIVYCPEEAERLGFN